MTRSVRQRIEDVRRLLAGARAVAAEPSRWVAALAESTGLSRAGVESALRVNLETDAADADLEKLVASAGDAPVVTVILSANVFTAPLRALAVARAAAPRVVVRPSRREPVFGRALVEATADSAIDLVDDVDVAQIAEGEIHVYGRDETIADVRARARVPVRAHGTGMGVAVISSREGLASQAASLAASVVPFDQRGCLSPRVALVDGDDARARDFAAELDQALDRMGIPRGALFPEEREEAARWCQAIEFAGSVWLARDHVVGVTPGAGPLLLPPPGRHVHVTSFRGGGGLEAKLAPFARAIVAVGTNDAAHHSPHVPMHARVSRLGDMQRPPLDGPVDLRRG